MVPAKNVRPKFAQFVLDSNCLTECDDAGIPMMRGRKKPRTSKHYSMAFDQLLIKTGKGSLKNLPIPDIIFPPNQVIQITLEDIHQIQEDEMPFEVKPYDCLEELESYQDYLQKIDPFPSFEISEINLI